MGFVSDLKFGNIYEKDVLKRLSSNAVLVKGKCKPCDIVDGDIKYECKSDRYTFTTHNLCIEFECSNKESGIMATESDFYFYYVINTENKESLFEKVYKIPTTVIREMIADKKYHKIQKGGDGWKSKFYLFRENLFSQYELL